MSQKKKTMSQKKKEQEADKKKHWKITKRKDMGWIAPPRKGYGLDSSKERIQGWTAPKEYGLGRPKRIWAG